MADHFTCSICLDFGSEKGEHDYFVTTVGGHIFHYYCIKQYLKNGEQNCPICREEIQSLSSLTRLYGIKLKKTDFTLKLQGDGNDGTLPAIKIVILGDSSVGKSSILRRFANQKFVTEINATCGCDVLFRNITINNKLFRLNLWDTAGQENYRSLVSTTVRGAHGIILTYDISSQTTLNNIYGWYDFAKNYGLEDSVQILVGNKKDLDDAGAGERKVSPFVGQAVSEKLGIPFIESSAKTGENIEGLFRILVAKILEKPAISMQSNPNGVNLIEVEIQSNSNRKEICLNC